MLLNSLADEPLVPLLKNAQLHLLPCPWNVDHTLVLVWCSATQLHNKALGPNLMGKAQGCTEAQQLSARLVIEPVCLSLQ